MKTVYLIGSLRNRKIPDIANAIEKRVKGIECFDSWQSPGPLADSYWRTYERKRGRTHKQALNGFAARQVFHFDQWHLLRADIAVLLMPAGKSAHLELGWFLRSGKPGFILFEKEPQRWDVMVQFATDYFYSLNELIKELRKQVSSKKTFISPSTIEKEYAHFAGLNGLTLGENNDLRPKRS